MMRGYIYDINIIVKGIINEKIKHFTYVIISKFNSSDGIHGTANAEENGAKTVTGNAAK